jgi:hypothetical protein
VARSLPLVRKSCDAAVDGRVSDRSDPQPRDAAAPAPCLVDLHGEHRRHVVAELAPELRRKREQQQAVRGGRDPHVSSAS